jgi:hypothetical protein
MSNVDYVKIIKESVYDKIKQSKNHIHESHNPVYNDSLLTKTETLE